MSPPAETFVATALWQAVKRADPALSDSEVDDLLRRAADQERELVLKHGLNLDQARKFLREELFPNQYRAEPPLSES